MKKITVLLFFLTCFLGTNAQTAYVYKGGKVIGKCNVSEIDSIVFREDKKAEEYEYVDLGLPSGTLWATRNVGASKPEECGLYFAWGETTGYTSYSTDKHSFDWENYKWCKGTNTTLTKYCKSVDYGDVDDKTELEPEDDAATANWGSDWQMPSIAQQQELLNNCYWIWSYDKKGYTVTSKTNFNSIFIPDGYFRYGHSLDGPLGNYWSRSLTLSYSYHAFCLYFHSSSQEWYDYSRCYGLSVRPVRVSSK